MSFPAAPAVPETSIEIGHKSRRLLTEAALLACIVHDVTRARQIAVGLAAAARGGRESVIAYAVADLTEGDIDAALKCLRPLADSGDAYAMVFQALALHLAGCAHERDAVLQRLPAGDPAVDGLAAALPVNRMSSGQIDTSFQWKGTLR